MECSMRTLCKYMRIPAAMWKKKSLLTALTVSMTLCLYAYSLAGSEYHMRRASIELAREAPIIEAVTFRQREPNATEVSTIASATDSIHVPETGSFYGQQLSATTKLPTVSTPQEAQSISPSSLVNNTGAIFNIRKNFTFPHPKILKDVSKVLQLGHAWLEQLKAYLTSIYPARTLTIVVASELYTTTVLNWLISATLVADPPLEHYIIVAFSESVHQLLTKRNITSLMVPLKSVIQGWSHGVGRVWMVRLAIIRLLNHWGYNVQHYDADAVILRNPESLFNKFPQYDIVGSHGKLSRPFSEMWGFAICMGAVLFRSTAKMERLWSIMHGRDMDDTIDDQRRVNLALNYTQLHWESTELEEDKEKIGTNQFGLRVAILPPMYICRYKCSQSGLSDYYVWHEFGGGHNSSKKIEQSSKSHTWFLRPDWKEVAMREDGISGKEWLLALATPDNPWLHHSL